MAWIEAVLVFGNELSAMAFCSMLKRETRPAFVEDISPGNFQLYRATSTLEFPEFARFQEASVHVRWGSGDMQVVDFLRAVDVLSGECVSAAYYTSSDELSADEEEIVDDGFYLDKGEGFVHVSGPYIEIDALGTDIVGRILYKLLSP